MDYGATVTALEYDVWTGTGTEKAAVESALVDRDRLVIVGPLWPSRAAGLMVLALAVWKFGILITSSIQPNQQLTLVTPGNRLGEL